MYKGIILDFDGTLVDTVKAYCGYYNEIFKDNKNFKTANPDKVFTWNLGDECPLAIDHCEDMFGEKGFWDRLELFPNALETVGDLYSNIEVAICSIGTKKNLWYKVKWIDEQLNFLVPNLILLSNKGVVMDKSIIDMKGYVLVDDNEKNLNSSNASLKICYGKVAEWNENWQGLRCEDWKELRKLFVSMGVLK